MADPLQRAVPLAPFRPSASAWNRMLDAAKARDTGAGSPSFGDVPHLLVRVRNDTGADLAAFSVVKLGASVLDIAAPLRIAPAPMFAGETPTGSSDAFAILVEPAKDEKWALAAVAGVVPVTVDVTDEGHGFAAPGTTADKLVSAASGPARILDVEAGVGDKKAVVLVQGGASAASFSGARVYNSSNQSVSHATDAILAFTAERFDTDGYHSTALNTSRLTPPAVGYYMVGATVWWESQKYSLTRLSLQIHDASVPDAVLIATQSHAHPANINAMTAAQSVATAYYFDTDDYVEVQVHHTNTDAVSANVLGSAGAQDHSGCEFWIHKIG
jgi:hypothetical protein